MMEIKAERVTFFLLICFNSALTCRTKFSNRGRMQNVSTPQRGQKEAFVLIAASDLGRFLKEFAILHEAGSVFPV